MSVESLSPPEKPVWLNAGRPGVSDTGLDVPENKVSFNRSQPEAILNPPAPLGHLAMSRDTVGCHN